MLYPIATSVVVAYRYDPFGVLLAKTGSVEQPYGFSTKRTDPRTGLVFFQYRLYDPPRARWLTRDPLGEAGGLNLYAFVGNNPVNWVDPWGLRILAPINMEAMIQHNQEVQNAMDFLPHFLLDMWFPTTPEGIADQIGSSAMGLVCPLDVSGGAIAKSVSQSSRILKFTNNRAVQKFFTKAGHGAELGLKGNWNPAQASATRSAINQFINSPGVRTIQGVYRGNAVTHYVNSTTGMNIMADQAGNFAGGWKLSAEQLQSVLTTGRLW